MKTFFRLGIFIIAFMLISGTVFATLGVGVGTGKIVVDEPLKPGVIYELPSLTVLNTGDTPSEYGIGVAYHEGQSTHRPSADWFTFKPSRFHLDPGGAQVVEIKMSVPVKTVPGDYFAYLEGFPVRGQAAAGQTSIGIAAAAKLYFTIEPANILIGIYYRVTSFWVGNAPWTNIAAGVLATLLIIKILKKKLNISIQVNRKSEQEWNKTENGKPEIQ